MNSRSLAVRTVSPVTVIATIIIVLEQSSGHPEG